MVKTDEDLFVHIMKIICHKLNDICYDEDVKLGKLLFWEVNHRFHVRIFHFTAMRLPSHKTQSATIKQTVYFPQMMIFHTIIPILMFILQSILDHTQSKHIVQ